MALNMPTCFQKAFEACEKSSYSKENEEAAVQAVKYWLNERKANSNTKVDEYTSGTKSMLLVASENGYPKVVQQLLEDEELVKIEVDRGAKALFLKYTVHEGNAHDAPRSGFAEARNKVKAKKREYGRVPRGVGAEEYPEWNRTQAKEQARYKSCYDMITLYAALTRRRPSRATRGR